MAGHKRRIDRVLDPAFLDGIERRPIAELRAMRADCAEEERLSSYERRLLHGRLAILRSELERRAGGEERSIIEDLPKILADERPATSRGAFPGQDPDVSFTPSRKVSKLLADDTLANLPSLSEDQIRAHIGELDAAERELSGTRRSILCVLDALNAELGRRYRTGEADPTDVLTGR